MARGKAEKLAEVARALNAKRPLTRASSVHLPPLFFFTDETRMADPCGALEYLPKDCGVVFRHYGTADRAHLAAATADLCRKQKRLCLIAGDPALGKEVGSNGIHLPEHMLRTMTKRPEAEIITAAAHGPAAVKRAEVLALNAVFLSPVFQTPSHVGANVLGTDQFSKIARAAGIPVYALGGITVETAPLLAGSGAAGVAAIGGLLRR